jgi:tRNA 2-thiocytidine biosynthesis protein TtcA
VSGRGSKRHASASERGIVKRAGQAIADFDMIADGDRIMVAVSGGKDSFTLLEVLTILARRAPVSFELLAVNVDQGWPGHDLGPIAKFVADLGVELEMVSVDIASVVERHREPNATPCSICARLRRGVLYNLAVERGCSKIALGHHLDDIAETLLLNLFFSGKLATMPALLHSNDGRNTVIRPLAYVTEAMIIDHVDQRGYVPVTCPCPAEIRGEQQRQAMKRLLSDLEADAPDLKNQILAAVKNVDPSHLLDRGLASIWAGAGHAIERK